MFSRQNVGHDVIIRQFLIPGTQFNSNGFNPLMITQRAPAINSVVIGSVVIGLRSRRRRGANLPPLARLASTGATRSRPAIQSRMTMAGTRLANHPA